MNALLSEILDAHGGEDLWRSDECVDADILTSGGFFALKGMTADAATRAPPSGCMSDARRSRYTAVRSSARRAYLRGPDRRPVLETLLHAVDVSVVEFR